MKTRRGSRVMKERRLLQDPRQCGGWGGAGRQTSYPLDRSLSADYITHTASRRVHAAVKGRRWLLRTASYPFRKTLIRLQSHVWRRQ